MWCSNTDKSLRWQGKLWPLTQLGRREFPIELRRRTASFPSLNSLRRIVKKLVVRQRWGVLAILLLWQGPIPICHAHGTLANSAVATSDLADHLVEAHQSLNPLDDVFVPWHWHWVVLSDFLQHCDRPHQTDSQDHSHCYSSTSFCVASETVTYEPQIQIVWPFTRLLLQSNVDRFANTAQQRPSNFLSTFAADQSLPERLSVFRC